MAKTYKDSKEAKLMKAAKYQKEGPKKPKMTPYNRKKV